MSGFIEGEDRQQVTLFPESLDEYIDDDNAVRVIDVFVDELDISGLGFKTEAYGAFKRALEQSNQAGIAEYLERKDPFIQEVLASRLNSS